jgi:hypothetical protein
MILTLQRRFWGEDYTVGSLYIDGEYFCDTLEDTDRGLTQSMSEEEIRKIKVVRETAIPTGVYELIVNLSPTKKRMLPGLRNVPGFSGILIHRGNTKNDSSGCILIGENKAEGKVLNSTFYEKKLVEILSDTQHTIKITGRILHADNADLTQIMQIDGTNKINGANETNETNEAEMGDVSKGLFRNCERREAIRK